jgi:hypothetical protein
MTRLKRLVVSGALSGAALALAAPSYATALIVNTGWQYDQVDAVNAASENSPITFTVPTGATDLFSLSDGFKPGDIYTVTIDGVISSISTFTTYSTPFVNNLGPAAGDFAADWLNNSFSHLQLQFGAGTYSLVVKGNGAGGLPAGVGERLDNGALAIPEPATWLTMLLGFGGLGLAMRDRRSKRSLTTA